MLHVCPPPLPASPRNVGSSVVYWVFYIIIGFHLKRGNSVCTFSWYDALLDDPVFEAFCLVLFFFFFSEYKLGERCRCCRCYTGGNGLRFMRDCNGSEKTIQCETLILAEVLITLHAACLCVHCAVSLTSNGVTPRGHKQLLWLTHKTEIFPWGPHFVTILFFRVCSVFILSHAELLIPEKEKEAGMRWSAHANDDLSGCRW